ncbi:MAG: hypothetical protein ACE5KX_06865 [Acidimicrobiia bacterium]
MRVPRRAAGGPELARRGMSLRLRAALASILAVGLVVATPGAAAGGAPQQVIINDLLDATAPPDDVDFSRPLILDTTTAVVAEPTVVSEDGGFPWWILWIPGLILIILALILLWPFWPFKQPCPEELKAWKDTKRACDEAEKEAKSKEREHQEKKQDREAKEKEREDLCREFPPACWEGDPEDTFVEMEGRRINRLQLHAQPAYEEAHPGALERGERYTDEFYEDYEARYRREKAKREQLDKDIEAAQKTEEQAKRAAGEARKKADELCDKAKKAKQQLDDCLKKTRGEKAPPAPGPGEKEGRSGEDD